MKKLLVLSGVAMAMLMSSKVAFGQEFPIGGVTEINGLEIAASYLIPQPMAPMPAGLMYNKTDIHLETDVHATGDNKNGFPEGAWIPYLTIHYKVTNMDTGKSQSGDLMPMVADDGPHYGKNIKLNGYGKYKVVLTYDNPTMNKQTYFGRHTSKESGVAEFWKPFSLEYTFDWKGFPAGTKLN